MLCSTAHDFTEYQSTATHLKLTLDILLKRRSQRHLERHLLAAIENNRFGGPIQKYFREITFKLSLNNSRSAVNTYINENPIRQSIIYLTVT